MNTVEDKREIKSVKFDNGDSFVYSGSGYKIIPYYENGDVWFQWQRGDDVLKRINGKYVTEVNYV